MGRQDFVDELDRSKIVALDFTSAEFRRNAHRLVADWARRPPFYVLGDGPPQVIVGRYADVHEVFSDAERFASKLPKGPGYEQYDKFMGFDFLTQMDGEQHARLRRLLMTAFSSRRMAQIELSIRHGRGHARRHRAPRPCVRCHDRIWRQARGRCAGYDHDGLERGAAEVLLDYQDMLPVATPIKPGHPYPPECQLATKRAVDLAHEVIAERRAGLRSDFLGDLVQARDQGDKLNDQELFGMIFGLFGALAATSRSAGGALYTLYTHTDQLAQLIRDPALIPDAIEECLRIASNGYFTFARIATRDTEVGGTAIRKGMIVRPSPLAANYDPDVFPDPLRFDIHRKPKRILVRCRSASLRRQHPRPHHHHHRDPPAAGALSRCAACRSGLRAGLWRLRR